MRKRLAATLPILILIFVSACDTAKPERETLLKQIGQLDSDLATLGTKRDTAQKAIETLTVDIQRFNESLEHHSERKTQLQHELASFLLDHKAATLAVVAAGGGAATFISDNIDEDTKTALRIVGVIGALYCIGNASECADVTAKSVYYGSQIQGEDKQLTTATSARSSAQSTLQQRQNELASVNDTINLKQTERDELKRKHDSLLCTFCI